MDPLLRPLQLVVAVGFRGRGKAAPVEAPSWTLTVVVETTMHEMLSSSKLLFLPCCHSCLRAPTERPLLFRRCVRAAREKPL